MTQSKSNEISAQKLCAGTVSGATPEAGGLYKRHQEDALKAKRLAILLNANDAIANNII